MPHVLAFAEARGGELRKVAFEAVSAARQVADAIGGEVHAVLVGAPGIAAKAAALAGHGADVVFTCEHDAYAHYAPEPTAALVAERAAGRIVGEGPDAVPELVRLLKEEAKVL